MTAHYAYSDDTEIGCAPTASYGSEGEPLTLAKVMAISGAAVNSHAGTNVNKPLTILLTLLNARLGNWLPNPRHLRGRAAPFQLPHPVWPVLFLQEMLSSFDATSSHCLVTDGGHFENLGVYELVRRKCRLVIASDAGCDPAYEFKDLERLKRLCTGLNCTLTLDESSLKPTEAGLAGAHAAIGRLTYPDGTEGVVVYVKSSLTGDEDDDMKNWCVENRKFPHDTTMDQFFSRDRFEQYRSLGRHIGHAVFGITDVATLQDVVQAVASQQPGAPATALWDVGRLSADAADYDALRYTNSSESSSKKRMLDALENAVEGGRLGLAGDALNDLVNPENSDYLRVAGYLVKARGTGTSVKELLRYARQEFDRFQGADAKGSLRPLYYCLHSVIRFLEYYPEQVQLVEGQRELFGEIYAYLSSQPDVDRTHKTKNCATKILDLLDQLRSARRWKVVCWLIVLTLAALLVLLRFWT